jgi:hypothetical protein
VEKNGREKIKEELMRLDSQDKIEWKVRRIYASC